MTPSERKRGALENLLAYFLRNEFDKEAVIQFFVYQLSDDELERMVKEFGTSTSIPPIIPKSQLDTNATIPGRAVQIEYVNTASSAEQEPKLPAWAKLFVAK